MEKGIISNRQLATLVVGFTLASSLVLSTAKVVEDRWLATLLGLGEGLIMIYLFLTLASRFPRKTFVQISQIVYGKILGKVIAALYIWFLFHLGALVLRTFGDYFNATTLTSTPLLALLALLAIVCASAARNGIEVIARCAEILVPPSILLIVVAFVLLLKDFELENFQPLIAVPWKEIILSAHSTATFPFAESVALLMIVPFAREQAKVRRSFIIGVLFAGLILLLAVVRNVGALGPTIAEATYPSHEALRLIRVGKVLTRLEILSSINFLALGFIEVSLLLYGTTLGVAQLLDLRAFKPLVCTIASLMVVMAIIQFSSIAETLEFSGEFWLLYAPFFQLVLPGVTLLIAMLRRLPVRERQR